MSRSRIILAMAFPALAMLSIGAAHADGVVAVDSRPGVTQPFLLLEPNGKPRGVVVLFPSEEGIVQFRETPEDGYEVDHVAGGLTAARATRQQFLHDGFAVAVIAPPSDRTLLSPAFRKSPEHLQDMRAVIDYLRRRYSSKPWLEGHCLSTLSVASVASALKGEGISGVIMSSTRSSGPAGAVTDFEKGAIGVPVLLVQHSDDSCPYTSPGDLQRVKDFYGTSGAKVDVIMVTGGKSKPKRHPQSCKDGYHGFAGVQKGTAHAIGNWLLEKPFPALVEGDAN